MLGPWFLKQNPFAGSPRDLAPTSLSKLRLSGTFFSGDYIQNSILEIL